MTASSSASDPDRGRLTTAAARAGAWGFGFVVLRVFAVFGYHWDTAFVVNTTDEVIFEEFKGTGNMELRRVLAPRAAVVAESRSSGRDPHL